MKGSLGLTFHFGNEFAISFAIFAKLTIGRASTDARCKIIFRPELKLGVLSDMKTKDVIFFLI